MSRKPPSHRIHDRIPIRLLNVEKDLPAGSPFLTADGCLYWRMCIHRIPRRISSTATRQRKSGYEVELIPSWLMPTRRDQACALYLQFDLFALSRPFIRRWFDRTIVIANDRLLPDLAHQLHQSLQQGLHHQLHTIFLARSLVDLAVARLFERLETGKQESDLLRHNLTELETILPALTHIETHLTPPPTNADLAEQCGMSEDYFIRTFGQLVGQTPARYARQRRIGIAAERLAFGNHTIKQVAADLGFANRYHFTRVFIQNIGISPARFRKQGTLNE